MSTFIIKLLKEACSLSKLFTEVVFLLGITDHFFKTPNVSNYVPDVVEMFISD